MLKRLKYARNYNQLLLWDSCEKLRVELETPFVFIGDTDQQGPL